MYESFFQFHSRPFSATPQIDAYYPSESIEQARHAAIRAIDHAEGPSVVIGPAGLGKTLLCRVVAAHFAGRLQVVSLSDAQLSTRKALLQTILFELGRPYRGLDEGELRLAVVDYLKHEDIPGEGILLVIDEAHTLPLRLLEELRMITNVERDGHPQVHLLLAGGPRLDERFASPKLESFNQRLAARCYLQPFHGEETAQYVRTEIARVGGRADEILAGDAYQAIYRASDGIPRLINQIANHALSLACRQNRTTICANDIEEAWADLQQLPTPWAEPAVTADGKDAVIEFGGLDDDATGDFDQIDVDQVTRECGSEDMNIDEFEADQAASGTPETVEWTGQDGEQSSSDASPFLSEQEIASVSGAYDTFQFVPDEEVQSEVFEQAEWPEGLDPVITVDGEHAEEPEATPEPELAENPFDDVFEEEKIVVELTGAETLNREQVIAVVEPSNQELQQTEEHSEDMPTESDIGSATTYDFQAVSDRPEVPEPEEVVTTNPVEAFEIDDLGDSLNSATAWEAPFDEFPPDPWESTEDVVSADDDQGQSEEEEPTVQIPAEVTLEELEVLSEELEESARAEDDLDGQREPATVFEYTVLEAPEHDELPRHLSNLTALAFLQSHRSDGHETLQCLAMSFMHDMPPDDADLITVDGEPKSEEASLDPPVSGSGARRVEYRQLFAQLRQADGVG